MLSFMNIYRYMWRKISPSHAIKQAGPLENAFFESVYRLVFITGLSTSDDYLGYTIYSTFIRSICFLIVCLETWHLFSDDLRLDDMISAANVLCIHIITIWKLLTMVSNKKVFKRLAKALELPCFDISTTKRKEIVKYWANTHTKYLTVLLWIVFLGMCCWQIFPLIDEEEFNLMVDVKLPYELVDHPVRYVLSYIAVGITFHYASYMVVMTEVITQSHLIPLICQFDVLGDCFENIFEECAEEFQASFPNIKRNELVTSELFVDKYQKRLGDLVTQHEAVLTQTLDLKTILSAPMLGEVACSGLLICCVGYQAIATFEENLVKFAMSLLYLSYHMFSLYLICRWCEEITLQDIANQVNNAMNVVELSKKNPLLLMVCYAITPLAQASSQRQLHDLHTCQRIGQAVYFSGWESGITQAPGVRATLMMVIARSNKPLVFVAGGMYPLSLSAYTNLVKASYSALNILLTMK